MIIAKIVLLLKIMILTSNVNYIIDLEKHRTPRSKVFTGRDRGIEVRLNSQIDQLGEHNHVITIIIPTDIRSISPSFLEEFLLNVVSNYGEQGFRHKFKFENPGHYKIENNLKEAIERILRR